MKKEFMVESVTRDSTYIDNTSFMFDSEEELLKSRRETRPDNIIFGITNIDELDEDISDTDYDCSQPIQKKHITGFFKYLEDDWWYCSDSGICIVDSSVYPLVELEEAFFPARCVPIVYSKWGKEFVYGYIDYDRNTKVISQIVVRKDCPLSILLFMLKDIMEDSLMDLRKEGVA